MAEITTLFWDVGGVILSNGWDRVSRRQAAERFDLAWEDFEERHQEVSALFETGRLSLEEYLEWTVFHVPRSFTRDEFKAFMFAQSQPHPEALAVLAEVARTGRYLLGTLNNESLELNRYRIQHFGLREYFTVFFSSCFLGVKKPDEAIYRIALQVTQREPAECVFIDDRALNLECARELGMHTIHYQNADQLRAELRRLGVPEAAQGM